MAEGGVGLNTAPFPSIGAVALPHVIVTPVFFYELPLIRSCMVQLRAWAVSWGYYKLRGRGVALWAFKQ